MITTMMNNNRGLTDYISCPMMEILNNILKSGAKEKHQLNPEGQAIDKKLRSQPTKMSSFMPGPNKSLTPDPPSCK